MHKYIRGRARGSLFSFRDMEISRARAAAAAAGFKVNVVIQRVSVYNFIIIIFFLLSGREKRDASEKHKERRNLRIESLGARHTREYKERVKNKKKGRIKNERAHIYNIHCARPLKSEMQKCTMCVAWLLWENYFNFTTTAGTLSHTHTALIFLWAILYYTPPHSLAA